MQWGIIVIFEKINMYFLILKSFNSYNPHQQALLGVLNNIECDIDSKNLRTASSINYSWGILHVNTK